MLSKIIENSIIDDINNTSPIFVMVIGGSASGKNYIYEKYFSNIDLIDNDKITLKLAGGDVSKTTDYISQAIKIANKDLEEHFKNHISVGITSTGASTKGALNRLEKAKSYGFKTAIVLVDTDVKTALKRNKERAKSGSQKLVPDEKVIKSNEKARETYKQASKITDFSLVIKN